MSQRNPMNERYMRDGHIGVSRKSAASAKPKSKAAASVTVGSRKKTPQERKAEQKKARREATERQREIDRKYYKPDTERYRKLRRLWWGCLIGGIACVIVAYLLRTLDIQWVPTAVLIAAYGFIILAFYIDFSKIRKERRAYQQRMLSLERLQEKEAKQKEAEARQSASKSRSGRRGGSAKSRKAVLQADAKAAEQAKQADASDASGQVDAASADRAPEKKIMGFFRRKPSKAETSADSAARR